MHNILNVAFTPTINAEISQSTQQDDETKIYNESIHICNNIKYCILYFGSKQLHFLNA